VRHIKKPWAYARGFFVSEQIGFVTFPRVGQALKTLPSCPVLPILSRNTPAMPMAASAAMHKLSGFFLPERVEHEAILQTCHRCPRTTGLAATARPDYPG